MTDQAVGEKTSLTQVVGSIEVKADLLIALHAIIEIKTVKTLVQ